MAEAQVGFLYNLAATLSKGESSVQDLLRSHYLMRCKMVTHGYGLPQKHFSLLARCPRCCLEWSKEDNIKIRPVRLSKRQRQRLKSAKSNGGRKKRIEKRKLLLCSNELEQICSFCKNRTVTRMLKPEKQTLKRKHEQSDSNELEVKKLKLSLDNTDKKAIKAKLSTPSKSEINLYTNALDIFALNNKNNTIQGTVKEAPKPIKNNKRKKDKFAGLCQKAVLASVKMKEEKVKTKQNNLDLFLKPSS